MMRRAHDTRSARTVMIAGVVGLILALCASRSAAQHQIADSFLAEYHALLSGVELPEENQAQEIVDRLKAWNDSTSGAFDTLMVPLFIWDYNRRSRQIDQDERVDLLRDYNREIAELSTVGHADMARFYALYIPAFRFRYQSDSVAHYLDLIGYHLDFTVDPEEGRIAWFFEKGRHAFDQSDYEASLTFFRRALDYLNTYFPDRLRSKYLLVNAIGIGYRRTDRAADAIAHYEGVLRNAADEIDAVMLTGTFLNNLGLSYKDHGDYPNAIRRLSDAIAYYREQFSPAYEDIGSGYDNIALCYREQGKADSALLYSNKSMDFMQRNFGPDHPDLLLPLATITETQIESGHLDAAEEVNARALSLLRKLGWSPDDPSGDYFLADAFGVFASAAEIQRRRYQKTADISNLDRAIAFGDHFMGLTDYAYDNLKNDLSKEIFQNRYGDIFSACIGDLYLAYQLNHDPALLEKAFAYTEKFKALELLYAAQKDKADQVVRFRILTEEYNAQVDSIRNDEDLLSATDPDTEAYARVFSRLNARKQALYLWKEETRNVHPDYYQVIYHPKPLAISELQHALHSDDQSIVSYHVADSAVYMFVMTASEVYFMKQELKASLPVLISDFRKAVYGYFDGNSGAETEYLASADQYVRTARTLYRYLVEPVSDHLTKRVIIVVDKALGYLPFDLLLSAEPDDAYRFRDHRYLLHDHAISYSYSARLWMDLVQRRSSSVHSMLAVAPDFPVASAGMSARGMRAALSKLYFNTAEVRGISRVIPATLLIGDEATKEEFMLRCQEYPILHLATHSKANDNRGDHAFLAFTQSPEGEDKLLASEIYNLKLQAELVALSACETGLGELKSGEGIISLARAFSFAGANTILSSLWSVNDQSTPAVMTAFYQNLKGGDPRDVALQKAKIDFVTSRGHTDAHPFYWGGFICVGDSRPMEIRSAPRHLLRWMLPVGIAGLLLIVILRSVRKARNKMLTAQGTRQ